MSYPANLSLPSQDPDLRRFLRDLWASQRRVSYVQYVDTQSMTPSLQGPVELLVEWGAYPDLCPGDLVIFEDTKLNVLVAHRVCQVEQSANLFCVLQAGDRLRPRGLPGGWINSENVFGRVIAFRFKGNPSNLIWLHRGWLLKLGQQISCSSAWFWRSAQNPDFPPTFPPYRRLFHWLLCHAYHIALFLSQEKVDDLTLIPSHPQKG